VSPGRVWFERMCSRGQRSLSCFAWLSSLLVFSDVAPGCSALVSVVIACLDDGPSGLGRLRLRHSVPRAASRFRFHSPGPLLRCKPARLLLRHVAPNLRPLFYAQFFISIPLFILTEANLSTWPRCVERCRLGKPDARASRIFPRLLGKSLEARAPRPL